MEKKFKRLINPGLEERCILYRGNIIHWMVRLEATTEDIIADHFCMGQQTDEFKHVILSKEKFSTVMKIDVLDYIIKNHYTEYENNKLPNLIPEFKRLNEIRNMFAHRKFFSMNEKVDKNRGIALEHYSTDKGKIKIKIKYFNIQEIDHLIQDMMAISTVLFNLHDEVIKKREGQKQITNR